jgi:hypothetical protein
MSTVDAPICTGMCERILVGCEHATSGRSVWAQSAALRAGRIRVDPDGLGGDGDTILDVAVQRPPTAAPSPAERRSRDEPVAWPPTGKADWSNDRSYSAAPIRSTVDTRLKIAALWIAMLFIAAGRRTRAAWIL